MREPLCLISASHKPGWWHTPVNPTLGLGHPWLYTKFEASWAKSHPISKKKKKGKSGFGMHIEIIHTYIIIHYKYFGGSVVSGTLLGLQQRQNTPGH